MPAYDHRKSPVLGLFCCFSTRLLARAWQRTGALTGAIILPNGPSVDVESLVRPAAVAHDELDVEDCAAGAGCLSSYEVREGSHCLDSDLSSGNGDDRQRWLDERGGGRVRIANDGQISGDVDLSRSGLLQHTQGEGLPGSEDGGGRVG